MPFRRGSAIGARIFAGAISEEGPRRFRGIQLLKGRCVAPDLEMRRIGRQPHVAREHIQDARQADPLFRLRDGLGRERGKIQRLVPGLLGRGFPGNRLWGLLQDWVRGGFLGGALCCRSFFTTAEFFGASLRSRFCFSAFLAAAGLVGASLRARLGFGVFFLAGIPVPLTILWGSQLTKVFVDNDEGLRQ